MRMRGDITINKSMGNQLSMEAWLSTTASSKSASRNKIVAYIRSQGSYGATSDEVEVALEIIHQAASARLSEALLLGLVVRSGNKRPTRSGRRAAVLVII